MTYSAEVDPVWAPFDSWRRQARLALSHNIAPEALEWNPPQSLFGHQNLPQDLGPRQIKVPQAFMARAQKVIWHQDPERFAILYQTLWAIAQGQGSPLALHAPLGRQLERFAKSVARDIHKIHAFVRFREIAHNNGPRRFFGAWFEPEHYTLEPSLPYFTKRFHDMDWLIATPHLSAQFIEEKLTLLPGQNRPELPQDEADELWGTYFRNIFNPARIKLNAMRSEMPKKYWKNLPETDLIAQMLKDAPERVAKMHAAGASRPNPTAQAITTRYRSQMPKPSDLPQSLEEAKESALHCRACGLCEQASQTVWGEGAPNAQLMIIGEQPGDHEDLAGRPFVGPAGAMLRELLTEALLDPAQLWLSNAVKHFKFKPKGRQRLHQSPNMDEITACRPWLGLELALIAPKLTIALGATAAFSLTQNNSPLHLRRGQIETGLHGGPVLISWHPAHILRLPDPALQTKARSELLQDLVAAKVWIENTNISGQTSTLP